MNWSDLKRKWALCCHQWLLHLHLSTLKSHSVPLWKDKGIHSTWPVPLLLEIACLPGRVPWVCCVCRLKSLNPIVLRSKKTADLLWEHILVFLFSCPWLFFLKDLFYLNWKAELQRGRKRKTFHLLVHFADCCNSWGRARLKPAVRSFFRVSHMGAGAQRCGPSFAAFSGALKMAWMASGTVRTQANTHKGCWHPACGDFISYTAMVASSILIFFPCYLKGFSRWAHAQ